MSSPTAPTSTGSRPPARLFVLAAVGAVAAGVLVAATVSCESVLLPAIVFVAAGVAACATAAAIAVAWVRRSRARNAGIGGGAAVAIGLTSLVGGLAVGVATFVAVGIVGLSRCGG